MGIDICEANLDITLPLMTFVDGRLPARSTVLTFHGIETDNDVRIAPRSSPLEPVTVRQMRVKVGQREVWQRSCC
jgi:hypothetical protein